MKNILDEKVREKSGKLMKNCQIQGKVREKFICFSKCLQKCWHLTYSFHILSQDKRYECYFLFDRPHTSWFLSCDGLDRGIYLKLGPLRSIISRYTIDFLRLCFPGIRRNLMLKTLQPLRYHLFVIILTDGIAGALTLHDVIMTSASWGGGVISSKL